MKAGPIEMLHCHFVPGLRKYLFGELDIASVDTAQEEARKRKFPLTVYVVGPNTEQIKMLGKLFSVIPSRVFQMKRTDFFTEQNGLYQTMGIDRLVTLAASGYLYGWPALVIDGGTAITYTAADSNGHIIGGGISPGISTRFHSMHAATCSLPDIDMHQIDNRIQTALDTKQPIPF